MSDTEYTPTTEEVREYVEVGGEPRPWEEPDDEKDAKRAAAFDRWLSAEITKAEARGYSKGYADANRNWQTSGDGRGLV